MLTASVSFGAGLTVTGADVLVEATFASKVPVVWVASSQRFTTFGDPVVAVEGEPGSAVVPRSQAGFVFTDGTVVESLVIVATVRVFRGRALVDSYVKEFTVLEDQAMVKLDDLPDAEAVTTGVVVAPAVTSVNGEAGAVLVATTEQGEKADSAYQLPEAGVPASDLTEAVRTSLDKADGAAQKDQNLNDVVDKAAARTNLDVFSKAEANAAIADTVGGIDDIIRGVVSDSAPVDLPEGQVWITTRVDTTPPSVPTGLTAEVSEDGIDLEWNASIDDSGAIGHYTIYRDGVAIAMVTALTYSDASAEWDTEHSYTVSATDPFDNESDESTPATATRGIDGAPAFPSALSGATLVAHFRASDFSGILADGATIGTLENRVSDGADLIPFGAPKYETGSAKPSIVFDGTNDAASAALGVYAQPVTKFVVFRLTDTASGKTILGTTDSAANRETFATGASQYSVYAGSTRAVGPAPDTSIHVAAVRYEGATSRVNIDGTVYAISSPGTEGADGIRVAANTTGVTRTAMELYDAAQYAGAVSDADLDAKVTELKTWYGIA